MRFKPVKEIKEFKLVLTPDELKALQLICREFRDKGVYDQACLCDKISFVIANIDLDDFEDPDV